MPFVIANHLTEKNCYCFLNTYDCREMQPNLTSLMSIFRKWLHESEQGSGGQGRPTQESS